MELNTFHRRQGQMLNRQAYFYTDTIFEFKHLLADDNLKLIIINSLKYLVDNKLAEIFGYVIMPNHIHLVWNILNHERKCSRDFFKIYCSRIQKIFNSIFCESKQNTPFSNYSI